MNDEQLKSLYKDSSTEQPSTNIDALILAEAEQELHSETAKSKSVRTGWRPVFATAASVTLVVALAFQLIPIHEQQLEAPTTSVSEPRIADDNESASPETTSSSDSMVAVQAERSLAPMKSEAAGMEKYKAITENSEEDVPNIADYAHSKADKLRKARIVERQRLRKIALQEQAATEQKRQESSPLVSQAGLQQELQRILALHENGQIEAAKSAWQRLQSMDIKEPNEEPNKSLWLQLTSLLD